MNIGQERGASLRDGRTNAKQGDKRTFLVVMMQDVLEIFFLPIFFLFISSVTQKANCAKKVRKRNGVRNKDQRG